MFYTCPPGAFSILFTDATTYPANHSLPLGAGTRRTVVLDFNQAANLPCA